MDSADRLQSEPLKSSNARGLIYVTSEISKEFFPETQSGGTFLPPEEIIQKFETIEEKTEDNPIDVRIQHVSLRLELFKFCPLCGSKIENEENVLNHIDACIGKENYKIVNQRIVADKKRYNCQQCGKQFSNIKLFSRHRYFCDPTVLLADHAISEGQHGVTENSDDFKDDLQKIERDKSSVKRKSSITCKFCGKTFSRVSYLKQHMRVHTGEKPFVCTHCGKDFADKKTLQNHLLSHTDDRPHSCDVCHKRFKRSDSLRYHKASHNPSSRPFICSHCAKSFKNQRDLRAHENNVHAPAVLPEECICTDCNTRFENETRLKNHRRLVHGNISALDCEYCGKAFFSKSHLNVHLRSHTGERPFKCSHCDKTFKRPSHLTIHEQRHTGNNMHKCNQCEKSFPQKAELKNHEKIHSSQKPYECGLCGKCFAREDYVRIHMKTHGGGPSSLLPSLDTRLSILPKKQVEDKHVYVMEPDVPPGPGTRHVLGQVAPHEHLAATIVIPAPGDSVFREEREVFAVDGSKYLYR